MSECGSIGPSAINFRLPTISVDLVNRYRGCTNLNPISIRFVANYSHEPKIIPDKLIVSSSRYTRIIHQDTNQASAYLLCLEIGFNNKPSSIWLARNKWHREAQSCTGCIVVNEVSESEPSRSRSDETIAHVVLSVEPDN